MSQYSAEETEYREHLIAYIENTFDEIENELSEFQTPNLRLVK
jgi:hypothetical protein